MSEAVNVIDDFEVLAVEDKGLYIKGNEDPWLILPHHQIVDSSDELGEAYRDAIES